MNSRLERLTKFLAAGQGTAVTGLTQIEEASEQPESKRDGRFKWRVSLYLALVAGAAVACVAYFGPQLSSTGWQGLLILTLLGVAFERVGIRIYGETHVSAGVVALFAIAIIYGAPGAAVSAPVVVLLATVLTRSQWHHRLFDMSSYTLITVSAALVFHALIDVDASMTGWWVAAALVAVAVKYALNIALVDTIVSLSTGERLLTVWRENSQWFFAYYVVFGLLALALAAGYLALGVPGIFAFVAPPLMMRFALHQYVTKTEQTVLELKRKNAELEMANRDITEMTRQLTETYDGTLEALVLALDARDHETKGHSLRVTAYVMTIARQLGVQEGSQEWIDMQRGALLHDVGKIGVSDNILHKPGPLTPEEWDDMKRHPDIGHEMLKDISFLSGAAAIVHAHHERFDGKGYPGGVGGDDVPFGAGIFAVADAFDAMTSDRPYRRAMPADAARDEIIRHSGTQFSPQVVQAFLIVFAEILRLAAVDRSEERLRAA